MSRLLFAAARGARIQRQHFTSNYWEKSRLAWVVDPKDCDYDYRIHPDDEHLQYGPISSAFQMLAGLMPACDEFYVGASREIANEVEAVWEIYYQNELHRSLFLLIMAEAMADEGM